MLPIDHNEKCRVWRMQQHEYSQFGESSKTYEFRYNSESMIERIFSLCICTRGDFRLNGYYSLLKYGFITISIGSLIIFGLSSLLRLILSNHFILHHQISYSFAYWIGIIFILYGTYRGFGKCIQDKI